MDEVVFAAGQCAQYSLSCGLPATKDARWTSPRLPFEQVGQVLYLGKATSLKRRVNSYFQKRRHAGGRTPELLAQTFRVDVVVTGSPLEAALREANRRFYRRFTWIEEACRQRELSFDELSFDEQNALWEEAKRGDLE